jgi:hypothetical protein
MQLIVKPETPAAALERVGGFAIRPIWALLFITMLASQPITPPMIKVIIKSIPSSRGTRSGVPVWGLA